MALPAVLAGAMGRAAATGGARSAATASLGSQAGAAGAEIKGLSQQFQGLTQRARQGAHAVTQFAMSISGQATKAMTLWIDTVQSMAAPVEQLVRVANPAAAERFAMAVRDAYGVVGRLLTPVLDAFTRVARKVGDVMAGLEPVFRPVVSAVSQFIDVVGDEFTQYIARQAPVFEMLAAVLGEVVQVATIAARAVGMLVERIGGIARGIAQFFGFDGSKFDPKATGVGAAARNARFVQPKEIANDAIRNALMAGRPADTEKGYLKSIDDRLKNFIEWVERNIPVLLSPRKMVERAAESAKALARKVLTS
jgi:hypothetical protein